MAEPAPSSGGPMWVGARVLAVDVPVVAAAAAPLLPPPLRMLDPPVATLFVADYPATTFGSVYREAAVILHAADQRGPARHCPWMVVDDDTALILGREFLGFPKKLAEVVLDERGDRVTGTVRRHGVEVMRLEAELGEADLRPAPLFAYRTVNLFGSIVGGMKLVELGAEPREDSETIHDCRVARVKVMLASSDRDPLGALAAPLEAAGRFMVLDFGGGAGDGAPRLPQLIGDVDASWAAPAFLARAL